MSEFSAEAASNDNYIKIGLKYGNNSVQSCTLSSEEGFQLGTAKNRGFEEGMPLPAYEKIIITNDKGAIVIKDEDGVLLSADIGSKGCIMPANDENEGIIYYEGTPYRGGIMLIPNSNGSIIVINYLMMEHYIYGVLNSEMGYTNPKEALKAQAVTARSYAELNLGKHSEAGFDLCPTTCCQVYRGYSGEYPSIIKAVDETRGEMIYHDGEPISAFYYKNSGGYTQNVEDVWSISRAYLRAVEDKYSPTYPWSVTLSYDTIQANLEAAGFNPGTVESVAINNRNMTGAVMELKITGSDETVYLKKDKIRSTLGPTVIKSLIFELTDSGPDGAASNWTISNGSSALKPDSGVFIISGNGVVKKMESNELHAYNGIESIRLGKDTATDIEAGRSQTVSFAGYGYGHGVGMAQDSAIEMAKQGFTYDEILEYFYTDIEIK
ncbi:MAG: SpoIID/LytB domain-containing protein [Eubacteriales bacterium]|nr:SpoIID/LytB domain-containing protein [Eubacteriales bacterium]